MNIIKDLEKIQEKINKMDPKCKDLNLSVIFNDIQDLKYRVMEGEKKSGIHKKRK